MMRFKLDPNDELVDFNTIKEILYTLRETSNKEPDEWLTVRHIFGLKLKNKGALPELNGVMPWVRMNQSSMKSSILPYGVTEGPIDRIHCDQICNKVAYYTTDYISHMDLPDIVNNFIEMSNPKINKKLDLHIPYIAKTYNKAKMTLRLYNILNYLVIDYNNEIKLHISTTYNTHTKSVSFTMFISSTTDAKNEFDIRPQFIQEVPPYTEIERNHIFKRLYEYL